MKRVIYLIVLALFFSSLLWAADYPTLSGESISQEAMVSGEKAILFFWTTWCPYCLAQIKAFNDYCPELIAQGFKIHFVNVGETKAKVSSFKKKAGIICPIILDRLNLLAREHRVLGIPTYIFLKNAQEIGRANFLNKEQLRKLYAQE